jgi:hypothetical protein
VDEVAISFARPGSSVDARRMAKAIARVAGLPMVELYGEFCVFRGPDLLDLSLCEKLRRGPTPADPGAPPPALTVSRGEQALEIAPSFAPRPMRSMMLGVAALAVISLALLAVDLPLGIIGLALCIGLLLYAVRARRRPPSRLVVGREQIQWLRTERTESLDVGALEMMRVNEATLVLIDHGDELRCDLPSPEAAGWARRAIEHFLAPKPAGPYR